MTERPLRLAYSPPGFPLALGSPFDPALPAAISAPATLWKTISEPTYPSSSVYLIVAQRKPLVKGFFKKSFSGTATEKNSRHNKRASVPARPFVVGTTERNEAGFGAFVLVGVVSYDRERKRRKARRGGRFRPPLFFGAICRLFATPSASELFGILRLAVAARLSTVVIRSANFVSQPACSASSAG